MSNPIRIFGVERVCIIGAGPSGLAAAKYLLAEKAFRRIDVFDQRARAGGIWDYTPSLKSSSANMSVPQTSPNWGLPKPTWQQSGTREGLSKKQKDEGAFLSPLYDRLETNIPRNLMGFSDLDWPQDSQLFPKHETVEQYLEEYAADVKHLINFQTQVLDVRLAGTKDGKQAQWAVKTQSVRPDTDGRIEEQIYDAVIVASGHFNVPFIPNIKGIGAWSEKHPGAISHSMYYDKPEDFKGQKVVVVGNGASGLDIATQIIQYCKKPLLQSQRRESYLSAGPSPNKIEKPEIEEFLPDNRAVRFADGSVEKHVDTVLFSTGYFYSFPFITGLDPPLIGDGTHVKNLYQHVFYRSQPTLAFTALQQRVIPFPLSEAESAVIARLWSGRLTLPSEDDMKAWEDGVYKETGGGRDFHLLLFPKDANYINMMHQWAMSATHGESKGKKPPFWGEKEYWMREQFPAIKRAFQERGEDRQNVRTLEELGFDFEEFKRRKSIEGKSLL